jgi:phosphatidate cytidylyltransferase
MLRTRIITGLILGALLLASIFYLPPNGVLIGFGIVFILGAWEWAGFGGLSGAVPRTLYAALVTAVLILAWRSTQQSSALITLFALASLWWVVAFLWLLLAPGRHQRLLTLACGFLVLPPAFVALTRLDTVVGGFARGPLILLWLIFIVCSADIGAYFAGRAFGKHKLAPRVSPGKTWEGAVGGLLSVALMAWGGAAYFGLPQLAAVLFGMAVGAFSIIGDLTESMFKRAANLKDSGKLLPGHGGLLDRLDSVTAAAPLYALGLYGSGVLK